MAISNQLESIIKILDQINGTSSSGYGMSMEDRVEHIAKQLKAMVDNGFGELPVKILGSGEYDTETGEPTVSDPEGNVFYLVPTGEDSEDMFEEWVYVNGAWEHFGAGGSVKVPQSDWNESNSSSTAFIKNKPAIESGRGYSAIAEGYDTTASGYYSHAEGNGTSATTACAHAEGSSTMASGNFSHAEGASTYASGTYSHAEGNYTYASGTYSHAEGQFTTASGAFSHAEGNGTTSSLKINGTTYSKSGALSDYSHSEGYQTIANQTAAHTEGYYTVASGTGDPGNHAEGYKTLASGGAGHAEGHTTTASGAASHSEGGSTIASGINAHAEGYKTTASGNYSHAEGYVPNNQVNVLANGYTWKAESAGLYSHVEGQECGTAYGANSGHAEGYRCYVGSGQPGGHAEGYQTRSTGGASHSEGYNTIASGNNSHTEGYETMASGAQSHAEGISVIATNRAQHVQGEFNIADDSEADTTERGNYVEIVGNGTADDARSNARTLDWQGNEWLAGNLTAAGGSLTIGSTTITEAQLQSLLALLNS